MKEKTRWLTAGFVLVLLALGAWVPLASAGRTVPSAPNPYDIWFVGATSFTGVSPYTLNATVETNGTETGVPNCPSTEYNWTYYPQAPGGTPTIQWCTGGNESYLKPYTYWTSSPAIFTAEVQDSACPGVCKAFAPVRVDTRMWVNVTLSANGTRPGTPVTVTAVENGGVSPSTDAYIWDLNRTSHPAGNVTSFTYTPAGAGNYSFLVSDVDAWGQGVWNKTVLEVLPPLPPPPKALSANVTLSNYRVQNGTTVTATATLKNATTPSYLWTTNGSTALGCSGATCSLSERHGGTYQVNLTVTDGSRVAWSQAPLKVWSNYTTPPPPPPPPAITATLVANATVFHAGGSVTLTAGATGGTPGFSYLWSENGTNTSSTGATLAATLPHAGNYTYRVWVTDSAGVVAVSNRVTVEVLPLWTGGTSPPPCTTNCQPPPPPPKTQPPSLVSTLTSPIVLLPLITVVGAWVIGMWYVRRRRVPRRPTQATAATSVAAEGVAPSPPENWDEEHGADEPEAGAIGEPEYDSTWVKEQEVQMVEEKRAGEPEPEPEPEPEVKVEEPTLGSLTAADVNPQAKPLPKSAYQAFSADVRGDTAHVTEIGGEGKKQEAQEQERIRKVLKTRGKEKKKR
ncbi:MAG: PKD domain-containing protein [Euryarchaeota archaeon]|nr:PKD domain-containing protein [Euryarchaeota archaeon]MDE1836481.1 PKD domain-containing protein [Euryarchaeota archaeon]MDE1880254.1 PKD domain-containing protein [Euryarchaeota archaeon]MDE2044687.1 PKD domain-containing protein [Thermoplasmata archaeon]